MLLLSSRPAGKPWTGWSWCGTRSPRSPHCPGGAIKSTVLGVRLMDRGAEKQALHEVLDSVRRGMSGALVLRGEPGVGKSALLGYVMEHAGDLQIVRTVAVESEMTVAFAAVHQLLSPLLPGANRLPEPQRRALSVAFGLVSGPPADPFWSAWPCCRCWRTRPRPRPVLCLVDDAQWLDEESADILGFVARRLLADGGRDGVRAEGDDGAGPAPAGVAGSSGRRLAGAGRLRTPPDVDQPAYRRRCGGAHRRRDRWQSARRRSRPRAGPGAAGWAGTIARFAARGSAARRPVRAAWAGAAGGHAGAALAGGGGPAGPRCSLDSATSV